MIKQQIFSPNEIIELFNSKQIDKEWSFEGYKPSETGKWTHDYHRYPAKFIPQKISEFGVNNIWIN